MADLATLQARLAEAETAYHQLQVGKTAVQLRTSGGRFVVYAPSDAARLAGYIESLKSQIAALSGSAASGLRRGPIRLIFPG